MTADKPVDLAVIGERLFLRRRQLRLEQEDVADRAGMSRPYVSRLERGKVSNPKIADIAAIAHALDTSLDALIGNPSVPKDVHDALRSLGEYPDLAEDVALLVIALQRATPEERDINMSVIRALIRRLADKHNIPLA